MEKSSSSKHSRIKIGKKQKIAFVCSGGGTKAGAFHIGVGLALRELGFGFWGGMKNDETPQTPPQNECSVYVGSSAGSIIASSLAAGYTLDQVMDSFIARKSLKSSRDENRLPSLSYQKMFKLRTDSAADQIKQFMKFRGIISNLIDNNVASLLEFKWLKFNGLFTTQGLETFMREEVLPSNQFSDYRPDLFIVGTQLNHSTKVVFGKYEHKPTPEDVTTEYNNSATISNACAASTALPFIYAPFEITNPDGTSDYYVDGEIRDTLSTHVAVDAGADLIFASHTHQPYHLHPEIGSLTKLGIANIIIQSIYLLIEQKINYYKHTKQANVEAIDAVSRYCRENQVSDTHRKKIIEILEKSLQHKSNVNTIYIHPPADDHRMFFKEHFTLSRKKNADIVKSGFKAAMSVLRKYDFSETIHNDDTTQRST